MFKFKPFIAKNLFKGSASAVTPFRLMITQDYIIRISEQVEAALCLFHGVPVTLIRDVTSNQDKIQSVSCINLGNAAQ